MEPGTRRRVLLDTTPRRLGRWLALSVALHAPLTPVAAFLGLFQFLNTDEQELPPPPPLTEFPLDLIEGEDPPPAAKPAEPEPPEPAAVVQPDLPKEPDAPKPKEPKEPKDAGAPDAATEADAGDAGSERKPGEGIADPVAGVGDKRVVDPNANVRLLVFNDRVRKHPLGGRVGPLLRNVYQWRDFFGPTAIDPIRDIDRMLIVGTQLRDSRGVVAMLQFNSPPERMRAAVDALVSRDVEGGWDDAGAPIAKAHADGGDRYFAFPAPHVLVVAPPSMLEAVKKMSKKTHVPLPQEDEIATLYLNTPWRAFLGVRVVIPKSIKSAKLRLSPRPDGGVVIDLVAKDETEPLAVQNAEALTTAIKTATSLDLGLLGSLVFGQSKQKFIEKVTFVADGTDIRGEIILTRQQVETLLNLGGAYLGGAAPKPRAPASATPGAAPVVPTPLPSAG